VLAKTAIRQAFGEAAPSYDSVAVLQRKVGEKLLKQLDCSVQPNTIVDIGCGTGFLLETVISQKKVAPELLVALDIAQPMLQQAKLKLARHPVVYVCADAEALPLQLDSVDWVISNLAIQWCNNPANIFAEIKRVLKPGGVLLLTTFGSKTLQELKTAWADVDNYTHVNDFVAESELIQILSLAGFKNFQVRAECHLSNYDSVWGLLAELKQLGAQTVLTGRNPSLTGKSSFQKMIKAYPNQTAVGQVFATFEVISVMGEV
jgi:malonyl-CoA O-methyltransferase